VATVCHDGTPNLSPKGTIKSWDDEHLVFADIHSPGTVENLLSNPSIEINMVDIFTRKGFRFKGKAEVLSNGKRYDDLMAAYGDTATTYKIRNIIVVKVERVTPVWSPVYDDGTAEDVVVKRWTDYWNEIHPKQNS
jgi:predicted pyridoxine 5'-phosphate oxidase superfamily flavin-nucleotide-binding protein